MLTHRCPRPGVRRSGFTLLELLVVIVIILALVALFAAAALRFMGVQQASNTRTTIQKVYSILEQQWKQVVKEAASEPIPEVIKDPNTNTVLYTNFRSSVLMPYAGGDAVRARRMWVKFRLKQAFPTSFAEVAQSPSAPAPSPGPLPALPTYYQAVSPYYNAVTGSVSDGPDAECSACLVLALSQSRGGAVFNPDDLGRSVVGKDTTNGLTVINDGWGHPIRLFRWPFNNTELDGRNPAPAGGPQQTFRDPDDPLGLLMNSNWQSTTPLGVMQFQAWCHPVQDPTTKLPRSWYMPPVIGSAGQDGDFGLLNNPPSAPLNSMQDANTGASHDNIYSYLLRLGG